MKKIVIALLLAMLILTGCSSKVKDETNYDLSASETIAKFENGDSFLLNFTSATCPACIEFNPVYSEARKEFVGLLFEIDYQKANANDVEGLKKLLNEYTGVINATPTILVITNGKVQQGFVGAISYADIENVIKNYGLNK